MSARLPAYVSDSALLYSLTAEQPLQSRGVIKFTGSVKACIELDIRLRMARPGA